MPRVVSSFPRPKRERSFDYEAWATGEILVLEQGVDFRGDPRLFIERATGYARRHDFAAVAYVAVHPDPAPGENPVSVCYWADRTRTWAEGPPEDVQREIDSVGFRMRRRLSS